MKSKHPELRWLAQAAYEAIRRWEEANESQETQETALEKRLESKEVEQ